MTNKDPQVNIDMQNIPGNLFERVDLLEQMITELQTAQFVPPPDGQVIDDLTLWPDEGITVTDPTSTEYTGGFACGEGIDFGGTIFTFGYVRLGVIQWGGRKTDAAFVSGAGAVTNDVDGIEILETGDTPDDVDSYKFVRDGATTGGFYGYSSATPTATNNKDILVNSITDKNSLLRLYTAAPASYAARIALQSVVSGISAGIEIESGAIKRILLNSSQADVDTVVQGDTDPDLIHADASADSVGFGIATPDPNVKVDIYGGMNVGNSVEANVLTVRSDANRVGMGGVTDPDYTLDVDGDVNVTGDFLVNGVPIAAPTGFVKTAPTTAAENTIQPTADVVGLTVKLPTGGTKNIIEVRDAADGIIDAIKRDGKLVVGGDTAAATITGYGAPTAGNYAGFAFKSTGNNALFRSVVSQSTAGTFEAALSANLYFSGGSWLKDVSGKSGILMDFLPIYSTTPLFLLSSMPESTTSLIYPFVMFANTGAFRIGSTAFSTTAPLGRLEITTNATTTIPLAIKAVASQTANSTIWTDSSDVVQASITPTGGAVFNENGAAAGDLRAESDTEANMLFLDADGDTDGALYLGGTTNGVKVVKGGHMTLLGTATVFEDLNFDPDRSGGPVATRPDSVTINNVFHTEFTSANNQLCGATQELPHEYKLGTTLYPHVHIFLKSGESAGTTGVTFTLYWELRQSTGTTSGSVPLSATSAELGTTAGANKFNLYDATGFAGSAELGGQLALTIARTGGDAGDIVVTTYGVHYEIDTLGSPTIDSK